MGCWRTTTTTATAAATTTTTTTTAAAAAAAATTTTTTTTTTIIIISGTQHCLCVSATLGKQIFGWSSSPSFYWLLPTFLCTLHQFFWTTKNLGKCRKSVVSEIKYCQWIFFFLGGGGGRVVLLVLGVEGKIAKIPHEARACFVGPWSQPWMFHKYRQNFCGVILCSFLHVF